MNELSYRIGAAKLTIMDCNGNETQVDLPWPVVEVLAFSDVLVVRLESPPGICFNKNVYGVLPGGVIAWQVKHRAHVYNDSPSTGMIRVEGQVKLMNWDGLELVVDPASGKEISAEYRR